MSDPFAWYWHDATGCLIITGDDRKPDVPVEAKPLYEHPPKVQVMGLASPQTSDIVGSQPEDHGHGHHTSELSTAATQSASNGGGSPSGEGSSGSASGDTRADLRGRTGADDGSGHPDIGHRPEGIVPSASPHVMGVDDVIRQLEKGVMVKDLEDGSNGWEYDADATNRLMMLAAVHMKTMAAQPLKDSPQDQAMGSNPVAWRWRWNSRSDWHLCNFQPENHGGKTIEALAIATKEASDV